ncbi:MAG: hypothetical protein ACOX7H_02105 [Bacillota bacterium]|jgi:hypothetical protein
MKKKLLISALCLALAIFLAACDGKMTTTSPESPDTSSSSEDLITTETSETAGAPDTFVNTAEKTTLFSGSWEVGPDIKAGKYILNAGSGMGNLVIHDSSGPLYINDILTASTETSMGMGVTKIQAYLLDGYTIQISGLSEVICSPAENEMKNTLITGTHIVGWDIAEGTYIITPNGDMGNLVVYNNAKYLVVNEIIGNNTMGMGVDKVKATLKEGYIIDISGINSLTFTEL